MRSTCTLWDKLEVEIAVKLYDTWGDSETSRLYEYIPEAHMIVDWLTAHTDSIPEVRVIEDNIKRIFDDMFSTHFTPEEFNPVAIFINERLKLIHKQYPDVLENGG